MSYTVQFRSSGIIAARFQERSAAHHWLECNDYGPDVNPIDPETGEVIPDQWVKGECLNLFTLKKVK